MAGKLIVLEGLSASGKQTQTMLLTGFFESSGKKAVSFAFPEYGSPVGGLIAQYLAGELGEKEAMVEQACLLYALDRYRNAPLLKKALGENDFVVLDRYTPANLAFQGALVEEKERRKLWKWIDSVEANLPQPDLVVFLDVPREKTGKLYAKRSQKNPLAKVDIHEEDVGFENRVHENYLSLSKERGWAVVRCVEGGELLPPEKVHSLVLSALKARRIL